MLRADRAKLAFADESVAEHEEDVRRLHRVLAEKDAALEDAHVRLRDSVASSVPLQPPLPPQQLSLSKVEVEVEETKKLRKELRALRSVLEAKKSVWYNHNQPTESGVTLAVAGGSIHSQALVAMSGSSHICACTMCDKTFAALKQLNKHVKYVHCNERVSCPNCPPSTRSFKNTTALKQHLRRAHKEVRHPSMAYFQCPKCMARFVKRFDLQEHLCSVSLMPCGFV